MLAVQGAGDDRLRLPDLQAAAAGTVPGVPGLAPGAAVLVP